MDYVMKSRMKREQSPPTKRGTAIRDNSYQFRNGNCFRCGKLDHYVRDCPMKKNTNISGFNPKEHQKNYTNQRKNPQFNPKRHQKNYTNQQSLAGKWTDGSKAFNFKKVNKYSQENYSKITTSDSVYLSEDYSSSASDFSEDFSSSASDSSEDYSSSASDSLKDYSSSTSYSFTDYSSSTLDSSEDYSSSASEFSSSSDTDSSNGYSTSVADNIATASHGHITPVEDILSLDCIQPQTRRLFPMSQSEPASTVSTIQSVETSTSHVDLGSSKQQQHTSLLKMTPHPLNELNGCEETQPRRSPAFSIGEKPSDEGFHVSIGTDTGSLSENIGQVSKERLDSAAQCHKLVCTMQNLSVVLLNNLSSSDTLSESDHQSLQSVICNLSQCLAKRMSVSTLTDGFAFKPEKKMVIANTLKTEKGCNAAEEEDPVRKIYFQMSAEAVQCQMVNLDGELNRMKSEIRCLITEIQMERLNKSHTGAHENENSETITNNNDVINRSCSEENLVMERNDFDYTATRISQEGSHGLPDLKNPIMDIGLKRDANSIEKHLGVVLSQNNISGVSILNSSLGTSDHNKRQPNADTETEQIEGQFGVLQQQRSCSEFVKIDEELEHLHLIDKTIWCDGYPAINSGIKEEKDSDLEDRSIDFFENHTEIEKLNSGNNNGFIDIGDYASDNTFLEGGAMIESPTETKSATSIHYLENAYVMHSLEESSCSDSDSSWEKKKTLMRKIIFNPLMEIH